MELEAISKKVSDKVIELGDLVYKDWSNAEISKTHTDGVDVSTNFDLFISKQLGSFLKESYPEIAIHDEEEIDANSQYTEGLVWLIDPIDGTKYFAAHFPLWSITVCLLNQNEPQIGIIYIPVTKQLFTAIKDKGAYLNGKILSKPEPKHLDKSVVAWDLPLNKVQFDLLPQDELANSWDSMEETHLEQLLTLTKSCYRIRQLGNGSFSLAGVATGLFQAYIAPIRPKRTFYDIAAGILLCQELGLKVDIKALSALYHRVEVTNYK